jgi:signal transduction histidine kinase
MNIYILIPFLSALFTLVLGFLVFFKNPNNNLNRIFFVFSSMVTVWLGASAILLPNCGNEADAIFWDKIVYFGVILIPPTCLHFSVLFTKTKKQKKLVVFSYLLALLFLIVNPTDYFTHGLTYYPWGCHTKAGPFHHLFILSFAFFISFVFRNLFHAYKSSRGMEKSQTLYIIFAFITLGVGVIGFLPAYGVNLYPYTYLCGLIAVLIITYAIVKHRLMDIRFVLRKYSVYLASLLSIIIPVIIIKYLAGYFFPTYDLTIDFILLVLSIASFSKLKDRFYHVANKYFFSSLYDAREVIVNLSEKLKTTLETEKIYHYISDTLTNSFHAKSVTVLLFNEKTKKYTVQYDIGHDRQGEMTFAEESGFYTKVMQKNPVIVIDEMKEDLFGKFKKTMDLFERFKIDVLVTLSLKDKIIGVLAIGPKESGDMFNSEDLEVLEIIGAQAAIAIENALLFEETKQFSLKLEKEVEQATKELRVANTKLKRLDQAKSEFISIASHQLRTPLTVIKGYVSMVLEGSFGNLDAGKKEVLNKVYESNERLIQLVENLLNISRIESGRLQFSFESRQIDILAHDIVSELDPAAAKKGLYLKYEAPAKPLPPVMIDEEKMRHVIVNLIDNAIKYTKKGGITVSLILKGDNIHFCSADTGVGIRPDDLPNLFKKFSRGKDMSLINPGGSGLGLYVAKNMIEAHHGKIWAESEGEGKGSRFCFDIPVNIKKEVR